MKPDDIRRMLKRRLKAAGLSSQFSPHSFRVCTLTDLLKQEIPREDVQYLAGHADARTILSDVRHLGCVDDFRFIICHKPIFVLKRGNGEDRFPDMI